MADADAKSGSDPWGDGYGSPGMNDPGPGHKYNFTAKTGVKSVRKACEMLNEGYDITEWPFTLAYVYSEPRGRPAVGQGGHRTLTLPLHVSTQQSRLIKARGADRTTVKVLSPSMWLMSKALQLSKAGFLSGVPGQRPG